jgi:tryptophanyl-tRNA synthetase
MYGRKSGYEEKALSAVKKMGKKNAKLFKQLQRNYQEKGDQKSLEIGQALLEAQQNISLGDKERLFGFLEGVGKIILPEPQSLLTKASKMPGLDGQKMSKSYGNTISLREDPDVIEKKIRTMPTDTARVRRTDPGNPLHCPVWQLHQVYSNDEVQDWVQKGCTTAGIGCIDCKQPVIDAVKEELKEIQYRAKEYINDPTAVKEIINKGTEAAREVARETLEEVKSAMGMNY